MLCSSPIMNEMLPEIHTMEKCDFLKPIIHSQIIQLSVIHECSSDDYNQGCLRQDKYLKQKG